MSAAVELVSFSHGQSVMAQTYDALREMIIRCELKPGAPIKEADLARQLGISRSPLREAVRSLEKEGFVKEGHGRSRIVAPVTSKTVLLLYEFRSVLEKFAADRAEGLISIEALKRETGKFDYLLSEIEKSNTRPFDDADFAFHDLYISRCGNPLIISHLEKLQTQLRRVRFLVGAQVLHIRLSLEEHTAIANAIRYPRPGKLAQEVERHVLAVGRRMANFVALANQQDEDTAT